MFAAVHLFSVILFSASSEVEGKDTIIHTLQTFMKPVESVVCIGIVIGENKSKLYCKAILYLTNCKQKCSYY
jgi:hypothetical protein